MFTFAPLATSVPAVIVSTAAGPALKLTAVPGSNVSAVVVALPPALNRPTAKVPELMIKGPCTCAPFRLNVPDPVFVSPPGAFTVAVEIVKSSDAAESATFKNPGNGPNDKVPPAVALIACGALPVPLFNVLIVPPNPPSTVRVRAPRFTVPVSALFTPELPKLIPDSI